MSKNVKFKLIKIIIALTIIIFFSFMLITSYIHKSVVADVEIESIINEIQSNSNYVQAKDINRTFLNAIVAIEDHRFYEHGAIDLISIARATLINIKNKEILEGGSTITQQLVKNVFLDMNQTFERKINEIFLAFELEKLYSKEENMLMLFIMEMVIQE